MTDAEKAAFKLGYVITCCNIENLHNVACIASDVLSEAGISIRLSGDRAVSASSIDQPRSGVLRSSAARYSGA